MVCCSLIEEGGDGARILISSFDDIKCGYLQSYRVFAALFTLSTLIAWYTTFKAVDTLFLSNLSALVVFFYFAVISGFYFAQSYRIRRDKNPDRYHTPDLEMNALGPVSGGTIESQLRQSARDAAVARVEETNAAGRSVGRGALVVSAVSLIPEMDEVKEEYMKYKIDPKKGRRVFILFEVALDMMLSASILFWAIGPDPIENETNVQRFSRVSVHGILPILCLIDLVISRIYFIPSHSLITLMAGIVYAAIYLILGFAGRTWLYSRVTSQMGGETLALVIFFALGCSIIIHMILALITRKRKRRANTLMALEKAKEAAEAADEARNLGGIDVSASNTLPPPPAAPASASASAKSPQGGTAARSTGTNVVNKKMQTPQAQTPQAQKSQPHKTMRTQTEQTPKAQGGAAVPKNAPAPGGKRVVGLGGLI
jgi:hypothetical protein